MFCIMYPTDEAVAIFRRNFATALAQADAEANEVVERNFSQGASTPTFMLREGLVVDRNPPLVRINKGII